MRSSDSQLRALSLEIPHPLISEIGLKITYLKFCLNLPDASELNYSVCLESLQWLVNEVQWNRSLHQPVDFIINDGDMWLPLIVWFPMTSDQTYQGLISQRTFHSIMQMILRNYLSISKLQQHNCWSLRIDKKFHFTLYNGCNYLSMLGLW